MWPTAWRCRNGLGIGGSAPRSFTPRSSSAPGAMSGRPLSRALRALDLDASVLLMGEVGFLSAKDPRFISTVEAMEKTSATDPSMRRYEARDDFGLPETAFNVCSFWRIDALARIGRHEEAREASSRCWRAAILWACSARTCRRPPESSGATFRKPTDGRHHPRAVRLSAPWETVVMKRKLRVRRD